MTRHTFLQLGASAEDPVRWLLPGSEQVHSGMLTEAAEALEGRNPYVFVSGLSVLMTRVRLPAQNRQRLLKAVRYALEEQLAQDVEQLHFAIAPREADGRVPVMAVARETLDEWLARMSDAGIRPRALMPQTLGLPWSPREWSVYTEAETGLVRTGACSGFAVDADNLEVLLQAVCQRKDAAVQRVRFLGYAGAVAPEPELDGLERVVDEQPRLPLLQLASHLQGELDPARTLNLLQNDYSLREQWGKAFRPWRVAAVMFLLWSLLQGGLVIVERQSYEAEAIALWKEASSIFQSAFPQVRKIVDPRVQMELKLAALRGSAGEGGSGFVGVISSIGPVLGAETDLRLRTLTFREGRVSLDLSIADLQRLETLKENMAEKSGMVVEIVSARNEEGRVEARLRLQEAGA
jgi:general secretion pathway protein L